MRLKGSKIMEEELQDGLQDGQLQVAKGVSAFWKALSDFQESMKPVKKDGFNPHFRSRYATLQSVMEVIRQARQYDLVVSQPISINSEGDAVLRTIVLHIPTGLHLTSTMPIILKERDNPQALGSAIKYTRRYSLTSMFCIVDEEDDDGEVAMSRIGSGRVKARGEKNGKD